MILTILAFLHPQNRYKLTLMISLFASLQAMPDPIYAKKYALLQKLKSDFLKDLLFKGADQANVTFILDAIRQRVDINVKNGEGKTALIKAVEANHTEAARALLLAGAQKDLQDKNGATALTYAEKNQNQRLIQLLKNVR
ncbi:ankyrin repeat domain-containing protein [bacterium]|nr:MAG: ankyrin repeat domain-containing protein [bacterium]QQR62228.1 MAG: ankyrin repeat domain-containing protein [bacterium]QQR63210.1 MAG: ankyrin repeat domain-containing protein [bacterium]